MFSFGWISINIVRSLLLSLCRPMVGIQDLNIFRQIHIPSAVARERDAKGGEVVEVTRVQSEITATVELCCLKSSPQSHNNTKW